MSIQHDMIYSDPQVNSHDTAILCGGRFNSARTLYVFSGSASAALEWYRRREDRDVAFAAIDNTIFLVKIHSGLVLAWLGMLFAFAAPYMLVNPGASVDNLVVGLAVGVPLLLLAVLLCLYCRADDHRGRLEREAHKDRRPGELLATCSHDSLLSSSGDVVTTALRARIDILARAELRAEAHHDLIEALTEHRAAHLSRTIRRPIAKRRGR